MLAGPDAPPPPGRPRPKVGGLIGAGLCALATTFATVVTAGATQDAPTGAEASTHARDEAATTDAVPTPVIAPDPSDPPETRTVQLDVTMTPPPPADGAVDAETTTAPAPVGPAAALGCPEEATLTGTLAEATFGYSVTPGSAPIVGYAIDYGDGASFVSDTVDGVFSHTYALGGAFEIRLDVTDANGLTATATCSWTFSLLDPLLEPVGSLLTPRG